MRAGFCGESEGLKGGEEGGGGGELGAVAGVDAYCCVYDSSWWNWVLVYISACVFGREVGGLQAGELRCSLASSIAFLLSSRSLPVTINFSHPASFARDMTPERSLGWRCVPW